jgi:hypothetical protein
LLVSLDLKAYYPARIISFAQKNNITADMVWLNETDADYFCDVVDKGCNGSIPATVIVNGAKEHRAFYEQEFLPEGFEAALIKCSEINSLIGFFLFLF